MAATLTEPDMDITALKIFLAVAETGGVTRAAEQLHYVQSNVTARLKQLEQDLGTPLFYRNGRRLQITPAGQILSGYAERILRLAEEARHAVQDSPEPRGTLLIGAMETTAAARMPQVLAQYHKRYPEVQLALETGTTRELIDAVLNYKLEAALIAAPLEHLELETHIAFEEELVLITDLQQGPIETPQDIRNLTLLVFRAGCRYRQHLENWVGKLGGVPKRIVEFGTFEAIIGCVAAGMGVSMMPRAVVEQHRSQGVIRIYPLPPDIARAPTLFIRRRDVLESSAMRAFRGTLGEVWRAENGVFGDAVRQF